MWRAAVWATVLRVQIRSGRSPCRQQNFWRCTRGAAKTLPRIHAELLTSSMELTVRTSSLQLAASGVCFSPGEPNCNERNHRCVSWHRGRVSSGYYCYKSLRVAIKCTWSSNKQYGVLNNETYNQDQS